VKTKLYWPDCKIGFRPRNAKPIDSYWLECTFEEARNLIFPLLDAEGVRESESCWDPEAPDMGEHGIETRRAFFLISKDLSSILPCRWVYPYSGQWGAYCPFRNIQPIEVSDLKKLSTAKSVPAPREQSH
jgi:hypothetical protein